MSKLHEAFRLDEEVVDSSKQPGKALENMGVRKSEIKDSAGLSRALVQVHSQIAFAMKQLSAIAKQAAPDVNLDEQVNDVITAVGKLKASVAPKQTTSPSTKQEPQLGKYRGYRSGE